MGLFKHSKAHLVTAAFGMAAGLILGLLCAFWTGAEVLSGLTAKLAAYLQSPLPSEGGLWLEALVKQLRVGVILWLLAFWPPASVLAYAVCAAKTFGAGFVIGLWGHAFGAGIHQVLLLIGLPLLVVLPAMAVLTAANRLYAAGRLDMRGYLAAGGIYAAAALLASLMEAFLLPII